MVSSLHPAFLLDSERAAADKWGHPVAHSDPRFSYIVKH